MKAITLISFVILITISYIEAAPLDNPSNKELNAAATLSSFSKQFYKFTTFLHRIE